MTKLTREEIYKLRPDANIRPRGSGKQPQPQISYPGENGKREQMPFVIPPDELDALDRCVPRGQRSATVRDAVVRLAMRLGLVSKSPARLQVERTAQVIGRDPDDLADELGVTGPQFRPSLRALAEAGKLYTRRGVPSESRAIRWAVKVFLAEHA